MTLRGILCKLRQSLLKATIEFLFLVGVRGCIPPLRLPLKQR